MSVNKNDSEIGLLEMAVLYPAIGLILLTLNNDKNLLLIIFVSAIIGLFIGAYIGLETFFGKTMAFIITIQFTWSGLFGYGYIIKHDPEVPQP